MKTALLVIDMQIIFKEMVEDALPNITSLINLFHSSSQPIVFTQHGHTEEELRGPPYKNQLVRKWGPGGSIRKGSKDWELLAEIGALAQGAPIVGKNTYDAFINTGLEGLLRDELEVDRLIICGVMTNCCCDTTARSAFNRGFETWLVGDACGAGSKSQRQAALEGWGFGYRDAMETKETIERLKREWRSS